MICMEMKSKNQIVRELVAQGRYKEALQICKDWNYENPNHQDILRRGYDCYMYPEFYRQLGKDPGAEYQKAVEVLKEVYSVK